MVKSHVLDLDSIVASEAETRALSNKIFPFLKISRSMIGSCTEVLESTTLSPRYQPGKDKTGQITEESNAFQQE